MAKHVAPPVNPGTPTQVAHPWRATVRTIFQAAVSFAAMWGLIVEAMGLDATAGWVAASLAFTGAITRIMALDSVDRWLSQFVPWLASGVGSETHEIPAPEWAGQIYPGEGEEYEPELEE